MIPAVVTAIATLTIGAVIAVLCTTVINNHPSPQFHDAPSRIPSRKKETNSICPICLNEINTSSFSLKCDHKLHTYCYRNLLRSGSEQRCPLCRKEF